MNNPLVIDWVCRLQDLWGEGVKNRVHTVAASGQPPFASHGTEAGEPAAVDRNHVTRRFKEDDRIGCLPVRAGG